MGQNRISILSTRALNDDLINDAAAIGMAIDVMPFIQTQPVQSIQAQQEIEIALMSIATVVFTSANAVEAVATELHGQHPDWQIFCIGHATRQAVEKYLGTNLIKGSAENATKLAGVIIDKVEGDEVIFFCGDQRRDELIRILGDANINVNEITVYQTIPFPHKLEKDYDGILFFSPSAVKSFFQNNRVGEKTILFAIGNSTSEELKNFSTNKIIVSSLPDQKQLLKETTLYFQKNPIHH